MSSIGVFREGEIDGEPFHIFTLLSQSDNPSSSSSSSSSSFSGVSTIDSGGDDLPFQPLFLCPSLRLDVQLSKGAENDYYLFDEFLPVNTPPHFSSTKDQYLLDSNNHEDIGKHHVVPFFWCNNKESHRDEFYCGACGSSNLSSYYYFCVTCSRMFHKECVESPLEIKHPSYPFLSLQLYSPPLVGFFEYLSCLCCQTSLYEIIYHCPTYKLSLHPICAMKPIPIVLNHPKRHPHLLTFFPKQTSLACDVCGLIKELFPTYICARCVFVVHQDCIYSPYVIKISRHHHRISFTYSLPSGKWSCGVCRRKVDNNYGAYTCKSCDDYFVHTRCALSRELWDGKELEGVPEEPEINVQPFERISDGIILHFSHGHHMKLEINKVYDEGRVCQACVFPIHEGNYYSCMDQCDFILHEACANAPLMKQHALHSHLLALKVVTKGYNSNVGGFHCRACKRKGFGFVYECPKREGEFQLDIQCALVSEPFQYKGHEHPLFLDLDPEEERTAICRICQQDHKDDGIRKLNCIECDYIICFKCATSPYKARYKHDKHFLTFYEAKEARDHSEWCDVCERKIEDSNKKGFYSCDDCCTTLHIDCLLGEDPYMKPGQTIRLYMNEDLHVIRNNTQSRPFCHVCKQHCPHKVVFKSRSEVCCSLSCADKLHFLRL